MADDVKDEDEKKNVNTQNEDEDDQWMNDDYFPLLLIFLLVKKFDYVNIYI